ncbi:uncharacterized protein LOC108622777 [Ceratina calcarata]|uniref:Uncharacterized protein LOC108622777 n=1 Tax=Ceratina calcarata TaxID=156304 RepID=A0AAJ7RXI4_9HYME|nr:uncharacterized protein LOC108622777 [Ceratina calcarata]
MQTGSILLFLNVLLQCYIWKIVIAGDKLRVAFQWKQLEYEWPSNETKLLFPGYKQEDNLPLGLEITSNRIFVTVPRWRRGVVSSLNYFYMNDTRESPTLIPYPSWEAHEYKDGKVPEIISTFRIRADRCERLWVLDTGFTDMLDTPEQHAPPALLVYDLRNDQLLRKFVIPEDQKTADYLFANIAVEDYSCEDSYAYLGDLAGPGLVVYSWKSDKSWLVKHHFFESDPKFSDFNVSGIAFHWTDGLFGMSLQPTNDGYSTMYFHPLSSNMEYSVSTKLLRDPERATSKDNVNEFHALGSRGDNGHSSVSFLDPNTGVLFYALTNMNAIACWKPQNMFTLEQQGIIYEDNITMVFPNDLKVDRNGNIWVLSDRLPSFMYAHLDPDDYNFRILTGSAKEAITDTVCSMSSPPITNNSVHFSTFRPQTSKSAGCMNNSELILVLTIVLASLVRTIIWIKSGNMKKIESTIPGLDYFPGRDIKFKTPYSFLESRRQIDGAEGLWRINNNLYDLEGFARHHPGGAEWIRLTKGTDITELFESHHITDKASKLLPKYFVREAVQPRKVPLTFKPDGFFHTFKRRAVESLKGVNFHQPATKSNLIADFLFITTILLSLATAHTQSYIFVAFAGIFLAWTTVIAHNYFHMRDNFRMYYFDMSLMSSKEWRITHVMSHHHYPNTLWDFELYAFEPFLMFLPNGKKNLLRSVISQIATPLVWLLTFLHQGIVRYYSVFYEYKQFEFRDAVPFLLPTLMCFTAPSILMAVKLWFLIIFAGSFVFYMIGLTAAHHHPNIFHDGDVYRDDLDWGILELDAVRDRNVVDDSDFLVLTNFGQHGLHHLLPTVDHCYLPLCVKAFEDTCKDFGISTQKYTSWDLFKGMFQQILRNEQKKNFR